MSDLGVSSSKQEGLDLNLNRGHEVWTVNNSHRE